jgi:hypothetical protein
MPGLRMMGGPASQHGRRFRAPSRAYRPEPLVQRAAEWLTRRLLPAWLVVACYWRMEKLEEKAADTREPKESWPGD